MNHYIFLTDEGFTFQPDGESEVPDVENLQVIGFANGIDADEAYGNFLLENPHLRETGFEKIFCYQLDRNYEQSRKDYNLREGDGK
jgi:hypothetical protein